MPDRITAILTVRDEGAFLIEWLAHHRAVGVTDFLVFSNDCSDGTDAMLDQLQRAGIVTHIPQTVGAKGAQWQALTTAATHPLVTGADWAISIDIDEFILVTTGDGTLSSLIAACPGAEAICLTWRMFGNPGILALEGPVTQTFTRAAPAILHWPWKAQMVKTLYRPAAFAAPGVHRPRGSGITFDGSGRPVTHNRLFAPLGEDSGRLARINHYALGSFHDFILKAARGRANRQGSTVDAGYWVERNFCQIDMPAPPLAPALADDTFRTFADQTSAASAWRRMRIKALLAEEGPRQLLSQIMLAGPTRLLSAAAARSIWAGARTQ